MRRCRHAPVEFGTRPLLVLVTLSLVAATACARGAPVPRPRIVLATPEAAAPLPAAGATAAVSAPVGQPPSPSLTVSGTFKVAAPQAVAATISPGLQALSGENQRLKFVVDTVADADAAARSGDDFAAVVRLPGGAPREQQTVVRSEPLAIMLPSTLTPDDLTPAQVVDLLSGAITDWGQLGAARRPVRLAVADPSQLVSFGALDGRPAARLAASVRVDAASTLLAGADAGTDEAVVVPWGGPRLTSKAVRIDGRFPDDGGYPLVVETLLVPLKREQQSGAEQIAPALAAKLRPSRTGMVSIDAMGDFMLARGVEAKVQKNGSDWPFAKVNDRLRTSDIRFGNLELAITDRGQPVHKDYTFRAAPAVVQGLAGAGINVVDVANNHVLDYGPQGLLDTIGTLDRANMLHVGAGADAEAAHAPVVTTVNGLRIAWLAYLNVPDDSVTGFVTRGLEAGPGRPGVAWGTPELISRDVAAAKQHADLVIVALHSGFEYTPGPNATQKDLAHAAIDAGAALVLGAHPHVLQGIEYYHGAVIAYSLGNFVFDLDEADRSQYGLPSVLTCILRVTLDAQGVTGLQVYPAIINSTDFRPEPVVGEAARPVFDRIEQLTDALKTRAQ